MSDCDERRANPRTEEMFRVELLDGGRAMMAHDLSIGGMQVTSHEPRWPGSLVRVRFRPPGSERWIRATCRVVDLIEIPNGIGISLAFLKLAPAAITAIERAVRGEVAPPEPEPQPDLLEDNGWVRRLLADNRSMHSVTMV